MALGLLSDVFAKPTFDKANERQVEFLGRIMPSKTSIGQVGGLDTDHDGNLIVFHRGSRKWSFDTFFMNHFNTLRYGPIEQSVLSIFDPKTMEQVLSWGSNRFAMPHGVTFDHEQNIWLTDVGKHQVFKYKYDDIKSSTGTAQPALVLGQEFKNGNDKKHFCKPTSVAVSKSNNDIFVADGYCNERVVQFNKDGAYVKEFEDTDVEMQVVHSIALIDSDKMVCAASREDGRIVCFDVETGNKRFVITYPSMKTVYAIEFDELNQVLHAVTGDNHFSKSFGLTFDVSPLNFGKFVQKWSHGTADLSDAHDLAISPDTKTIYVGQLNSELDFFSYN